MEEDVRTGLIFSSITFNLSVISALPLIHSANAALDFVVWSIFPCLWIPLVKNADHADASFRSRSSSLSLVSQVSSSLAHGSSKLSPFTRELLPQPLWSCMTKFQTLINCPKIKFSDHKAAAGAVRRRRICVISGFSRVRQEAIASPSSQGQKQITDPHPVFNAQICFPHTLAYIFFHFSEIRYAGFAALISPRSTAASSAK